MNDCTALVVGAPALANLVAKRLYAIGVAECRTDGANLEALDADPPSSREATRRAAEPDCLVVIAGEPGRQRIDRDWQALARSHLAYPERVVNQLVPGMAQRGRGLIVLAQYLPKLSTAALSDLAEEEVVAGTRDLVQNLNSGYGPAGIRAIAVFVDTRSSTPDHRENVDDDGVAEVIVWCCTNRSISSITEMRVSSVRNR